MPEHARTAPAAPTTPRRLGAEFLGTFALVFTGCGAAVLASGFPTVGIGLLGVSFAFGLSVLVMAYAVGHVSGGHFNPAVTVGLAVGNRFAWREVPAYLGVQVVAAIVAAAVLWVIANGKDGFDSVASGFASNGYGDRSPDGYNLFACLLIEVVLTAFFLYVILGATDTRAPRGFAPIAIGLSLTLIHLVSIPVTNTSVNPARSIGPALFAGWDAIGQLWLFILAPLLGAAIAGISYHAIVGQQTDAAPLEEATEA